MKIIEPLFQLHSSYKCLLLLMTSVLIVSGIKAQTYPIENGDITVCSGTFADDGNAAGSGSGGPYQTGMSYTFTICPDTPGDVISVEFSAFLLYTSPNPNNSDYLQIYDGDSDQATSLGSYTGNSLQGLPVTGSVNNTSGCLTFVFSSNSTGPGNLPGWEANIVCTTPCDAPSSASEIVDPVPQGPSQSIGVCLDAPITFGDNGSSAASGFNLDYYIWNYDDGTIDTLTGPQDAVHSYTEPGEYLATLSVVDNNGCRSLNVDPLQILVSTIPIFNTDFESPVCVGTNAEINGAPVQSVTWTALPPQVVAGQTYLADGAGFEYSSCLTFDFFEPDATLDNCSDLLDVFVNMEHSYLGDLGISITCPDGTTVQLLDQGTSTGGATYLGEAVDEFNLGPPPDDDDDVPGTGYNYGWSPTSTNGFIYDDVNSTETSYTNNSGGVETNHAIANPGFYQSNEDMCNLVGCPLNGDWCINVTDFLASDNGYIFEWGIDFNPALFPDVTTFTPVIGLGADSTFWEGPNVVNTSGNGNLIQTAYDTPGSYDYTFFATNNFGCTFDTTITVEVIEGPDITAGPDQTYCNDPVTLQAGLANVQGSCGDDSGTFEYCYEDDQNLVVTYCPDNPGDGVTFMEFYINSGTTEYADDFFVYDGDNVNAPVIDGPLTGDLSGMSFGATNPSGCITFQIIPDGSVSCASGAEDPLNISASCNGGTGLVWSWSPADGLSDPNVQNPTAQVDQSTTYTVSAYPPGFPGCVITDQVTVSPDEASDPGLDTDTTLCYNSPVVNLVDYLDGTPAAGGSWTDPDGDDVPDQFNPTTYPDGANFTYMYTVTNGTCTGNSTLDITILPVTNSTCCQTNAQAGPDATPCALTYQLQAEPTLGIGTWTAPPNVSFSDIHDPEAIATCTSPGGGDMTLTWTDNNGSLCTVSDDILIHFADSLSLIVIPEDAVCYNQCNGTAVAIADGGTTPSGNYTYDWKENGTPGSIPQTRDSLCSGLYTVKVFDSLGCKDSTTFQVNQPEAQEIFVSQTPPLCADSCDGQIVIQSDGAVDYSFDSGDSFQESNVGKVCAGEHNVIARDTKGCEVNQDVNLINPAKYEADFNINPLPTTTKNTKITFQDVSRPGPVMKSLFTFGDNPAIGTGEQRISTFIFPKDTAGVYPVELISTNTNGCIDTLIQDVIIKNDLLWYIPNSFSPNGDGINDIWKPVNKTLDISDYELTIVNRWGQVMFQTKDPKQGWNGSDQGDGFFVDAGVYTYLIKVTSETTEEKVKFTGFITVLR